MKRASVVVAVVVGFALAAVAQTKAETWDAAGVEWAELRCSQNADATVDCVVCLRPLMSSIGTEERPCSRVRTLKAANTNRVDTVARALIPSALRAASFDVDAGAP